MDPGTGGNRGVHVEHDGAGVLGADSQGNSDSQHSSDGTNGPGRHREPPPDGQPTLIIGDVRRYAAFNHLAEPELNRTA